MRNQALHQLNSRFFKNCWAHGLNHHVNRLQCCWYRNFESSFERDPGNSRSLERILKLIVTRELAFSRFACLYIEFLWTFGEITFVLTSCCDCFASGFTKLNRKAVLTLHVVVSRLKLILICRKVAGWSLGFYSQWLDEHTSEEEKLALIK